MVQVSGFQDRLPLELACHELPQEAPKKSTSRSHPFIQLLVSRVFLEFSPRETWGKDPNLTSIFFKWVGEKPPPSHPKRRIVFFFKREKLTCRAKLLMNFNDWNMLKRLVATVLSFTTLEGIIIGAYQDPHEDRIECWFKKHCPGGVSSKGTVRRMAWDWKLVEMEKQPKSLLMIQHQDVHFA